MARYTRTFDGGDGLALFFISLFHRRVRRLDYPHFLGHQTFDDQRQHRCRQSRDYGRWCFCASAWSAARRLALV